MAIESTPFPTSTPAHTDAGFDNGAMLRGADGNGAEGDTLNRVVRGAHDTIDRLADTAAPHVNRWSQGLHEGADQVRATSDEWAESLRCTVRENPLAAVAAALAIGMVAARLSR